MHGALLLKPLVLRLVMIVDRAVVLVVGRKGLPNLLKVDARDVGLLPPRRMIVMLKGGFPVLALTDLGKIDLVCRIDEVL